MLVYHHRAGGILESVTPEDAELQNKEWTRVFLVMKNARLDGPIPIWFPSVYRI